MPNCKNCQKEFPITDKDREFYKKISTPEPTFCPDCRCQRRMAFRNERNLYKVKSFLSENNIFSCYHPDEKMKAVNSEEWWGDGWEGLNHGREFDFNQPFFKQFDELQREIPIMGIHGGNNQNCPYSNYAAECKNCHMVFGSVYSEDSLYGNPYYCKNCVDSLLTRDCELCYDCVTCEKCYECFFCQDCANSNNLTYCYDCHGCSDCIGCVSLRNKKFHIFNKAYSEIDYKKFRETLNLKDKTQKENILRQFNDLKLKLPHRHMVSLKVDNCTGDYIYESKNSHDCYDSQRAWDCAYLAQTIDMKDCHDCNYTEENELCHEYIAYYRNNNVQYSVGCFNSSNLQYCAYCISSKDLFGCIGLKHKQYCIFNKQYTKEEYEKLRTQIIEHMKTTGEYGEFFPISISPFCYNETVAMEYFPLTKEEALAKGYRWREKDPKEYLPATEEILACVDCKKNYRLQDAEKIFYQKFKLPIPEKCPDCRHHGRLALRTPRHLFARSCAKCHKEISTTYAPDRPETIYCEECYLKQTY